MPVMTHNGVLPKRSRLIKPQNADANVLHNGLAASQHGTTAISGTSYQSPFTDSAKPLWNATNDNQQQVQTLPLKAQAVDNVIPANQFVKVHPWEKGTPQGTTTTSKAHQITARKGGPDPKSDTPFHPDDPKVHAKTRPSVKPSSDEIAKRNFFPSFLRSGGTLGGHIDPQAGTSSSTSRWSTTKKGAAG